MTLLCAPPGEIGEISGPSLSTPETLGYARELELRAATAQIGPANVCFLPSRDSGMVGTPENEDERCLHQPVKLDSSRACHVERESGRGVDAACSLPMCAGREF